MLREKYQPRKRALQHVDIEQPYAMRYWCQSLGCTEQQLRWAVREVGPVVDAIEELFGRRAPLALAR